MGAIASADTVYATAYLTELGRQYLFQDNNHPRFVELSDGTRIDKLKIERFSLGDPDVNYKIPDLLTSGDMPDLSGENENSITGAKGRTLNNLISPSDSILGDGDDTLEYSTSEGDIMVDLNKDLEKIPTVFTQELLTLIDEEPTLESTYDLLPKNFGENQVKDNELIIPLRQATTTSPGYRMRILYPTIEDDHNICTIQFERANILKTTKKAYEKAALIARPEDLGSAG
tara:strand:+ start:36 stop:725 length:690 start_codon:yes stop_codon:yes gene_type:complete